MTGRMTSGAAKWTWGTKTRQGHINSEWVSDAPRGRYRVDQVDKADHRRKSQTGASDDNVRRVEGRVKSSREKNIQMTTRHGVNTVRQPPHARTRGVYGGKYHSVEHSQGDRPGLPHMSTGLRYRRCVSNHGQTD